jgi:hypothetical protein
MLTPTRSAWWSYRLPISRNFPRAPDTQSNGGVVYLEQICLVFRLADRIAPGIHQDSAAIVLGEIPTPFVDTSAFVGT